MVSKSVGIGSLITLAGALVGGWQFMHSDLVPVTRAQHDADLAALQASTDDAVGRFYLNWRCDEWMEELDDLLDEQVAGDSSPQLAERIRRLRDKIDENDCEQFE